MVNTLIRFTAAMLVVVAATLPASAISRIRADQNSCASVQQTILSQGAAVVRYPSTRIANYFLYDRYVSPRTFCGLGDQLVSETVPAADNPQCVVYKCKQVEPIFNYED